VESVDILASMSDAAELGRLIRESRLKKGMSLGQLASTVGRSSSSVRRWERGEVPPAKAIIGDLAVALDLEPSQLDDLRPGPSLPEPIDADAHGQGPSTLEHSAVGESSSVSPPQEPVSSIRDSSPSTPSVGMFGDLVATVRSTTEGWSGWIRGLLTAAVLIVMLVILVWAAGELFSALGEVWDSFDTESTP
jgi:transcriptional regulator with XRE-family HTH domain